MKDPALGVLFTLKADVLKVPGVPQGVEVAFDSGLIVYVADFAEDSGSYGVGRDAAVAMDDDANDEVLLAENRSSQKQKRRRNEAGYSRQNSASKLLYEKKMETKMTVSASPCRGRVAGPAQG